MNSKIKISLISIFILLLVSVLLVFGLRYGKVNHQLSKEFMVTIKGRVTTSKNIFDVNNPPQFVRVYHSYSNLKNLCEADVIKVANITWDNKNKNGNYIITFTLPVEEEVVITTNCNGCIHKPVYVSRTNNSHNIDLIWDTSTCSERRGERFQTVEAARQRANNLLDGVGAELEKKNFNKTIIESIKNDIQSGREHVRESGYPSDDNTSLSHAYYAIFYGRKGFYKIDIFDLKKCLDDIEEQIQSHSGKRYNESCYIIPYKGYEGYKSANSSFVSFLSTLEYLDRKTYDSKGIEGVLDGIDGILGNKGHVRTVFRRCEDSLRLISTSFEHQESYCNRKEFTFDFINWVMVTIALLVGLTLGKIGRRWNE